MYQPMLSPEQLRNIKEQELLKRMKSLEELLKTTSETATKEIEAIKAELEEIKPEEKPWPQHGDMFWTCIEGLSNQKRYYTEESKEYFIYLKSINMAFRTREEAETKGMKKIKRWQFENELQEFADKVNGDWKWNIGTSYYSLYFNIVENAARVTGFSSCLTAEIKFKNQDVAIQAIDHFGERLIEYLKG